MIAQKALARSSPFFPRSRLATPFTSARPDSLAWRCGWAIRISVTTSIGRGVRTSSRSPGTAGYILMEIPIIPGRGC
jgi:hypothetical protein